MLKTVTIARGRCHRCCGVADQLRCGLSEKNGPRRFTATTLSKLSSVASMMSARPGEVIPALFTSRSSRPKVTRQSRSSGHGPLAGRVSLNDLRPQRPSFQTKRPRFFRRPSRFPAKLITISWRRSRASASAIPRPIPREAPVIRTTGFIEGRSLPDGLRNPQSANLIVRPASFPVRAVSLPSGDCLQPVRLIDDPVGRADDQNVIVRRPKWPVRREVHAARRFLRA